MNVHDHTSVNTSKTRQDNPTAPDLMQLPFPLFVHYMCMCVSSIAVSAPLLCSYLSPFLPSILLSLSLSPPPPPPLPPPPPFPTVSLLEVWSRPLLHAPCQLLHVFISTSLNFVWSTFSLSPPPLHLKIDIIIVII